VVVLGEELTVVDPVELLLGESAFTGAVRTEEDGVYRAEVVVALEPAEADPEAANEDDAPGPEVPEEALA